VNAAHIILDYVAICEKRREILDLNDFIGLWVVANEIAEEERTYLHEAYRQLRSPSVRRFRE
jgi:hypothetical protein